MGDFDLIPPSLPGTAPVRKKGFFDKIFGKDSVAAPAPQAPATPPQQSTGPAPNIDEIKRKLGIDSEPEILPVPTDDAHQDAPDLPRTPVAPPVGMEVKVDDWTQDERASLVTPTNAPASTPWDKEISLDDIKQEMDTPQLDATATVAPAQSQDQYPPITQDDDRTVPPAPSAPVSEPSAIEAPATDATPIVPEGKPEHHELIEKHLADLSRQHEEIEKRLEQIASETPQLPEWKLQEREVTPDQYFFLRNGQPIRSLAELAEALEYIDDITFEHHVNEYRNDFANWVRDVLGDDDLATRLNATEARSAMLRELLSVKQRAGKEIAKEQRELQKTIAKRKEAVRTLLEAEKDIAELQRRLEQKSKELSGERKRSAKLIKERLDAEIERRLKAERSAMLKARGDLAAAKREYDTKIKGIDAREKAIAEREKRVMLDETQSRKDIEMVSRMKQEIEPMLRDAAKVKADLEAVRRTEAGAKKVLAETQAAEASMTRKEEALRAREKKAAEDLTKITAQREELARLKADLDKRESAARKLEGDAKAMMDDAKSRRDAALATERASRERINADFKALNALKAKIDKELAKTVGQKEKISRAVGLRKRYAEAISEAKHGIADERARMESEGYASFMKEKVETTPAGQPSQGTGDDVLRVKHADIYAKVESCRQALEGRDLAAARRIYTELREEYARASMGPTDKETLYNDIRELYDDIHLMMLAKQQ